MTKLYHLFLILSFSICTQILNAQNIYVSVQGNDSNDGSINNPFKTFNKAISVMSPGNVCIIREGVYEQSLVVNKNGTAANNLTFQAADGEKVEIRATKKLSGWQLHSGNIYKTSVNMAIESRFRAVYHNEDFMNIARWPNDNDANRWTIDCTPVTGGDGSHFLVGGGIQNIDWTGGLVYYLGSHSGTSWTRSITSSTTTRINYAAVDINKWPFSNHNPTHYEGSPGNKRGQLYLFNKLEALDYGREWYYDASAQLLYFQTADGSKPEDNSVEYATNKFSVELKGDYIKIKGLHIFGGSVKIHNNADNNSIENCSIIHGSEGHDALNNTSAQVGEASIEVLGDNTVITGSTINHSMVSGIVVSGWAASNCLIEKNTITNMDYLGIHASPIRCSASNSKVLKNTLKNAGRDGMYVTGVNFEVAYNDVSYSQIINSDSGVFYTVGNDNLRNAEIHHNWFHDATAPSYSYDTGKSAKAAGIYLDNDSKGFTVHHNVVWNVSWTGYQINWNNTYLNFFHNTLWNNAEAMGSWVNGRSQNNNKVYNNYSSEGDWFAGENGVEFDIKNNIIDPISPFEDANNQNFFPKAGSTVIDNGPIISGFTKPFKGAAPDLGAYELGGTRWTAGINAIEDTGEGIPWEIKDTQFTIKTTTESCPDNNDGSITIKANFHENYVAYFDEEEIKFSNETTFENVTPNTYDLCISIEGKTDKQCFSVTLEKLEELQSKSIIKDHKIAFNIEKGTAPFTITINNDPVLESLTSNFSIDVAQGDQIKITSSKECEGEIVKTIDFSENIVAYPNPTKGLTTLDLPISEGKIAIEIYNSNYQLISSKIYQIVSGKTNLDLSNQSSGIYIVKILGTQPHFIKIMKQ
jgi:hypothetical protein